jgi:hypothetical protein
MAATKVTLYPIKDRWVHDVPYGVHVAESKTAAAGLIESGAFTDDPKDPGVDRDAPDLTIAPVEPEQLPGVPVDVPPEDPPGTPVPLSGDAEPEPPES